MSNIVIQNNRFKNPISHLICILVKNHNKIVDKIENNSGHTDESQRKKETGAALFLQNGTEKPEI